MKADFVIRETEDPDSDFSKSHGIGYYMVINSWGQIEAQGFDSLSQALDYVDHLRRELDEQQL